MFLKQLEQHPLFQLTYSFRLLRLKNLYIHCSSLNELSVHENHKMLDSMKLAFGKILLVKTSNYLVPC